MTVDLFDCRSNKYSQNGEDGIIARILSELGKTGGFLVEFGAWDGKHLSNGYNLIEQGWSGCLIEGDEKRFETLCRNIPSPSVIKVQGWVSPSGPNSLDAILQKHNVGHVDLLSIDIDSDDLAIWEGLSVYSPDIVIIEYNPTIPFDTRYRNPPGSCHGNSALSILELGTQLGYALVAGTDTNLIFLKRERLAATSLREVTLQEVRDRTFQLRYFFSYDGQLLHTYERFKNIGVTELFPVPWAYTFAVQPVPKWLRRGHEKANLLVVAHSVISAAFRSPGQLFTLGRHMIDTVSHGRTFAQTLSMLMKPGKLATMMKATPDQGAS